VAKRVVTYRQVVWAIESFVTYKSPGMHGIFPALLQEGRQVLAPCTCLAAGYVPLAWRQVKVVFIPKPLIYILLCLDVFTKFVKLYALRAATRTCLQKITKYYTKEVVTPKCILSDNGTQFTVRYGRND
jgi:hypothetical protein